MGMIENTGTQCVFAGIGSKRFPRRRAGSQYRHEFYQRAELQHDE
jgi:hypothetical protein